MKTLTIEQFETLLKTGVWTHQQHIESATTDTVERYITDAEGIQVLAQIDHTWGHSTLTSKCGDVEISYMEEWSYDECDADSFALNHDHGGNTWEVEGVTVVDEDSDEIDPDDYGCFDDLNKFSTIDYVEFTSDIDQTDDIDGDTDMTIEQHIVEIDNKPNLRFNGEVLAGATSKTPDKNDRWTELALFKTVGGKYVCGQIGATIWQGEKYRYSGCVCETVDEVIEYFGHGWLAKELYSEAGIEAVQDID